MTRESESVPCELPHSFQDRQILPEVRGPTEPAQLKGIQFRSAFDHRESPRPL